MFVIAWVVVSGGFVFNKKSNYKKYLISFDLSLNFNDLN
jgi:hypothetical protein